MTKEELLDRVLPLIGPHAQRSLRKKLYQDTNGCLVVSGGQAHRYPGLRRVGKSTISYSRFVYELYFADVPSELIIRHKCDNSRCINPEHLEPGTKKDNRRDFMARHPRAKELTLAAAYTGAKGVKRFWDNMSLEERAAFIAKRRGGYFFRAGKRCAT